MIVLLVMCSLGAQRLGGGCQHVSLSAASLHIPYRLRMMTSSLPPRSRVRNGDGPQAALPAPPQRPGEPALASQFSMICDRNLMAANCSNLLRIRTLLRGTHAASFFMANGQADVTTCNGRFLLDNFESLWPLLLACLALGRCRWCPPRDAGEHHHPRPNTTTRGSRLACADSACVGSRRACA